ncbi:MAG: histidine triad nucleotide-binding protein [Micavibrio aeruginosavorus]|uniref:Histidine triad nucleotide-binding protein n=1 Tax=Micavibrio aeruginosavorus TaxID=349221 RepID=A0A2W5FIQ9_9BACT|nr:MAG: histidine triad nucleotide-binding protein [Micavibrio aeruginosavorus]
MTYDDNNIFARILRGEIPSRKIYEDDFVLAFHDAFPKAPVHALVIPKGKYLNIDDFNAKASDAEILAFYRAIPKVVKEIGVSENGFRTIANTGSNGGQEVPHFHLHIVGGKTLGAMLAD